jgi:hypothetical protein
MPVVDQKPFQIPVPTPNDPSRGLARIAWVLKDQDSTRRVGFAATPVER